MIFKVVSDSNYFYDTLKKIYSLEKSFLRVLELSCKCPINRKALTEKLFSTVRTCGYSRLADCIIDYSWQVEFVNNKVCVGGLKRSMTCCILQSEDKFSKDCRELRRVVRALGELASSSSLAVLETLWRESIAEWLHDFCTQSTIVLHRVINVVKVVDELVSMLRTARDGSRLDMAATRRSIMSADLAFATTFRRLPEDISVKITKSLAVRISSLIDSLKQPAQRGIWGKTVDSIADLIQASFVVFDFSPLFSFFVMFLFSISIALRLYASIHLRIFNIFMNCCWHVDCCVVASYLSQRKKEF